MLIPVSGLFDSHVRQNAERTDQLLKQGCYPLAIVASGAYLLIYMKESFEFEAILQFWPVLILSCFIIGFAIYASYRAFFLQEKSSPEQKGDLNQIQDQGKNAIMEALVK